ncbi:MAG TPA: twin-arginine translocation signal domain-containing protein, partial [Tepidisphaeraceae bacterium]|nr:twin-arginine translocation signal domain-containing protein [Tepidisphaeraceae bacterium]
MQQEHSSKSETSRRDFVKGAAATAAVAAAATMSIPRGVYAQGTDVIKVGLVGCGGRGSGAAQNALNADPGVKIVAMGDMFADKLARSHQAFMSDPESSKRVDVP